MCVIIKLHRLGGGGNGAGDDGIACTRRIVHPIDPCNYLLTLFTQVIYFAHCVILSERWIGRGYSRTLSLLFMTNFNSKQIHTVFFVPIVTPISACL